MAVNEKKIRVQLDFNQQGFDELEELKTDLRAGSRADTVRYGLGLLRWAVNQLQGGARILVEKDGELSGVVFPFLPSSQVKAAPMVITLRHQDRVHEAVRAGREAYQESLKKAQEREASMFRVENQQRETEHEK